MRTATLDTIGTEETCASCGEELLLVFDEAKEAQIRCGCRCASTL